MKQIRLSLRGRIAVSNMILSSGLILLVFSIIYLVVYTTVTSHHDDDLDLEASEIFHSLVILNDSFIIANPLEWTEKEHKQIEVNPTFMQIMDSSGWVVRKTGNLLNDSLAYNYGYKGRTYINTNLHRARIRQLQQPIVNPTGTVLGYYIIATPLQESDIVLSNLLTILMILFPIITVVLFFSTKLIAGKSIAPVAAIIKTAEQISRKNIAERITLPQNQDELFSLAKTINELLNRLEDTLEREKQFTSDASHELRTPLSAIKGTLEVLIRKPRSVEQYQEKIIFCINEVNRIADLIEQLLMLARFDAGKITPKPEDVELNSLLEQLLSRYQTEIEIKNIRLTKNIPEHCIIQTDHSISEMIIGNIISNAIKYSRQNGNIKIEISSELGFTRIAVRDDGTGMTEEQIKRIFDRFYMADESRRTDLNSVGLGLSIVKKLVEVIGVKLTVASLPDEGTLFTLFYP